MPGRTPEMERIRKAFRAPPGTTLLSIDYDQLGLYVIAFALFGVVFAMLWLPWLGQLKNETNGTDDD